VRGCKTRLVTRRRDFIASLCGAAVAPIVWPLSARAQQRGKLPTIGFLGATTPSVWSEFVDAFVQRLRELGWIDGRNIAIAYRWAEGHEDRYAEFAAEFVRLNVDVIVTAGTAAVIAARQATSVIPIVFAAAGDPVGTGLVASLARPGGNVTGLSVEQTDLGGYRLQLFHEVIPGLRRVAIMGNVDSPNVVLEMNAVQAAAPKLGLETLRLEVRTTEDIWPGIMSLKGKADGLYVCTDPLMVTNRVSISTLAISEKLPTMNAFRAFVQAGGLMSYGANFPDLFRRAGEFVDKILRGTKPADIPVEQPVKFDFIINLTTAKALGLTIAESFLIRADEVIE
jgi:putative ABC transport system substrate-binding protein